VPLNSGGIPKGGGGRDRNNPGRDNFKETEKPLPPAPGQPPANPEPSPAPDVPQSALTLRKLQDLLKEGKFTPNVERQLGMTKDEAEQFVKSFKKPEQPGPVGPGREIKARPGEEKVIAPDRKGHEFSTNAVVSNRNDRSGSTIPQDTLNGLSEGLKSSPPPEIRRQVEAYFRGLNGARPAAPSGTRPPAGR